MTKTSLEIKNYFSGDSSAPLRFRFVGIIQYIPLILCGGFFLTTILVFAFGPLDWSVDNKVRLYAFLIACVLALTAGYLLAVKKGRVPGVKLNLNTSRLLIVCAVVYFILYIPTVFSTTGKLYPDIITGLFHSGSAYRNAKSAADGMMKGVAYVRMLFSPFMIMIPPITLFFMPKLTKTARILGLLVLGLMIALGISQGVNKTCADFTMQIVLFLMMLFFSNRKNDFDFFYRMKVLGLIVLVCGLFFLYYSLNIRGRVTADNESVNQSISEENVDTSIIQNAKFRFATSRECFLYDILPEKIKPTALFLVSYTSHGYKGLSLAMDQDFTSSYGLGFSTFFTHNILKVAGRTDLEEMILDGTYPGKISREGWQTGAVWSTFFVYPASDISFPGTVLLVFLIGYLFALAWKDALSSENPFAIVVFFNFCIMIFYFSANNQLFQGGESFIGFIGILIVWMISRQIAFKKARIS